MPGNDLCDLGFCFRFLALNSCAHFFLSLRSVRIGFFWRCYSIHGWLWVRVLWGLFGVRVLWGLFSVWGLGVGSVGERDGFIRMMVLWWVYWSLIFFCAVCEVFLRRGWDFSCGVFGLWRNGANRLSGRQFVSCGRVRSRNWRRYITEVLVFNLLICFTSIQA